MNQPVARSETNLVAIKGTKHGLTVTLLAGPLPDMMAELDDRLRRTAAFFKGAQVTLHVENPGVSGASQLSEIESMLLQHDITLRRISVSNPALAAAAAARGLEIVLADAPEQRIAVAGTPARPPLARASNAPDSEAEITSGAGGLVLHRTIRNGTAVRHEGSIVIIGDVNPGAELVAGGDIVVWGKLRGLVHAGALGDGNCVVCALHLEPTQLRIGNTIARMPDRKKRKPAPEMAGIRDGKIEIVEWS